MSVVSIIFIYVIYWIFALLSLVHSFAKYVKYLEWEGVEITLNLEYVLAYTLMCNILCKMCKILFQF